MKKILLGSVALAAVIASPAMAADYAAPRRAATFVQPANSWTGIYVGGNVGRVWGWTDPGFIASCNPNQAVTGTGNITTANISSGFIPNANGFPTCFTAGLSALDVGNANAQAAALNAAAAAGNSQLTQVGTSPFRNHGWMGGGQIGFNYQYQWVVFGLEADFQAWNPKGSTTNTGAYQVLPGTPPCSSASFGAINAATFGGCEFGFSESSSGKWLSTVRGKVGAVWGNYLLYGTMGLAVARMSFTSNFADTTCIASANGGFGVLGCNLASSFTVTQTKAGFAGGGGISYLLTNNIILSLEYLYAEVSGYGGDTQAVTTANTCATLSPAVSACNARGAAVPVGTFNSNFHYDTMFKENMVRAKLDFKL